MRFLHAPVVHFRTVLIAGLGNPGSEYTQTRHNLGFLSVDHFVSSNGGVFRENDSFAYSGMDCFKTYSYSYHEEIAFGDNKVVVVKPITYMNRSGAPFMKALSKYHISADNSYVSCHFQFSRSRLGLCFAISPRIRSAPFVLMLTKAPGVITGWGVYMSILVTERFPS